MSALALLGGEKTKSKPFPIWPHYDQAEESALKKVLESRIWWRTPGTKTLEFEQAFARFHGVCRDRHGWLHGSDERGRHPESSELSASAPAAHVSQW